MGVEGKVSLSSHIHCYLSLSIHTYSFFFAHLSIYSAFLLSLEIVIALVSRFDCCSSFASLDLFDDVLVLVFSWPHRF